MRAPTSEQSKGPSPFFMNKTFFLHQLDIKILFLYGKGAYADDILSKAGSILKEYITDFGSS